MPKKHKRINSFMIRKVLKIISIFKSPGEVHENSCKRKIKYLQIGEKNVFAFAVDTIQFTDCIFGSISCLLKVYSLTPSFFKSSLLFWLPATIYCTNRRVLIIRQNNKTMGDVSSQFSTVMF